MRIAIPSEGEKGLEETVALHFGRCPAYTVLDEEGRFVEVLKVEGDVMMHSKLPPEFLKEHRVDVVLCRDMGAKASMLCSQLGIKTYSGMSGTVEGLFRQWKDGQARMLNAGDGCAH
jgi:predicted Fe-Mo cluster-binding NifX family protein